MQTTSKPQAIIAIYLLEHDLGLIASSLYVVSLIKLNILQSHVCIKLVTLLQCVCPAGVLLEVERVSGIVFWRDC